MNIPFFTPNITNDEQLEIKDVLGGNSAKVDELEDLFASKIGASHAISTSNGTSAMHLCLCAIDLKRGDKIICPVNSHPFIAETIRYFDAEPIFVDIDEENFLADIEKCRAILEKNDSKKLRALIISHHAGATPNLDAFYDLAKEFDIKLIEDATTALGATYGDQYVGATGADVTIFSFHPELQSPLASGGMLATDNDEIAMRARLLRYHAIKKDDSEMHSDIEYLYDVIDIGCKYDINQLDAAFSLAQLKKVDKSIAMRKEIAKKYSNALKDTPHVTIPTGKEEHIYTFYIIKIDKNRDGFAKELLERGVHTSLHHIPMHLHSYYKHKYSLKVNDFPNALRVYQQILSLPIYSKLTDAEIKYLCDMVNEVAKTRV